MGEGYQFLPQLSMGYERNGIYYGESQKARKEWKRDPGTGRIENTQKPSESSWHLKLKCAQFVERG